jgi:TRAP-type C4-dicarboxylate transport system permease small subunit
VERVYLKNIEEKLVVMLIALLIILVFLAASLRWFGVQVAWSIDIAQLLFAWICFVGGDLALRNNKHVGVDMLTSKFPLSVQNVILLFNNLLILSFLGMLFSYGLKLCIENYQRNFNTIPVSYSTVTLSVVVGSILMLLTTIGRIKKNVSNIIQNDYSSLEKKEILDGGEII